MHVCVQHRYIADHHRSFHTAHLSDPAALPAVSKAQVGHGLDPAAFVFASFNQPFKITPEVWGVWMRLLMAVPHAQLWVVKLNEGAGAEASLRAAAAALGLPLRDTCHAYVAHIDPRMCNTDR